MTLSDFILYVITVPFASGVGMIVGYLGYTVLKQLLDRREPTSDETREAMIASFATCFIAIVGVLIIVYQTS